MRRSYNKFAPSTLPGNKKAPPSVSEMILQHFDSKQSNFVKLFRDESKQSKMIPKYLIYDGFHRLMWQT
jgi:hypothetical protein